MLIMLILSYVAYDLEVAKLIVTDNRIIWIIQRRNLILPTLRTKRHSPRVEFSSIHFKLVVFTLNFLIHQRHLYYYCKQYYLEW